MQGEVRFGWFTSKPTLEAAEKHLILYLRAMGSCCHTLSVSTRRKKDGLFCQVEEEKQKPMMQVFCKQSRVLP